jgi:hypothetical protein
VGNSTHPGASIYPPISRLREVSRDVAAAVARAIVDRGEVPPLTPGEIEDRIEMWEPVYRPYRPA